MKQAYLSVKSFAHKHKKWEPLVFFLAGFTFDAMLLHRIDDPLMLAHQALYLSLSAFIIAWDLFGEVGRAEAPATDATPTQPGRVVKFVGKLWSYREGVLHFLLGTLLNVYTIFYFKSGTLIGSLSFIAILGSLLFLNEVRPANIPKHILRNALFALCLISYVNVVFSILIGSIGFFVFVGALLIAAAIHYGFSAFLKRKLDPAKIRWQVQAPFLAVVMVVATLYFAKVLPPVPLSVKHIGIYHDVQRADGDYRLGLMKPEWKFWESGDQSFSARPGDKIFCFIQVFSPSRFHDQLFVRWAYYDAKAGWTHADAIPLGVVGGREEGFRGFTSKANYSPGDWRVSVETSDGREIGRISLTVAADSGVSGEGLRYIVK